MGSQDPSIDHFQNFINEFVSEDGRFVHWLWDSVQDKMTEYEIPPYLLARYFKVQFEGQVERIQISTSGARELRPSMTTTSVECQATLIYWFREGLQVSCTDGATKSAANTSSLFAMEIFARCSEPTTSSISWKSGSKDTRST